jgi:MYXO-CTERM domain-containing protein
MPGYSATPLVKKLGIAPAARVLVIEPPDDYRALLAGLPADVHFVNGVGNGPTLVHVFVTRRDDLQARLVALRDGLAPAVPVWVSWPKKASRMPDYVGNESVADLVAIGVDQDAPPLPGEGGDGDGDPGGDGNGDPGDGDSGDGDSGSDGDGGPLDGGGETGLGGFDGGGGGTSATIDCACSTEGGQRGGVWALLGLLGLVGVRRKRARDSAERGA